MLPNSFASPNWVASSAAGFVRSARDLGARTLELNLEPSQGSAWFHECRHGPATEVVPAWVEEMLG